MLTCVRQENRYEQGGKRKMAESPPERPKINQSKLKKSKATWPGMFEYFPDKRRYLSIAHVFIVLIM